MSLLFPSNNEESDKNGATLLKAWSLNEFNFYSFTNFIGVWTPEFYGTVVMRTEKSDRIMVEGKTKEPKEVISSFYTHIFFIHCQSSFINLKI